MTAAALNLSERTPLLSGSSVSFIQASEPNAEPARPDRVTQAAQSILSRELPKTPNQGLSTAELRQQLVPPHILNRIRRALDLVWQYYERYDWLLIGNKLVPALDREIRSLETRPLCDREILPRSYYDYAGDSKNYFVSFEDPKRRPAVHKISYVRWTLDELKCLSEIYPEYRKYWGSERDETPFETAISLEVTRLNEQIKKMWEEVDERYPDGCGCWVCGNCKVC